MSDFSHRIESRRTTIRRKPHHLVLVTVMGESEILSDGLIENTERMWKVHTPLDGDVGARSHGPRCTGKVAEPVHRDYCRLVKGTDMECGRHVGGMMLHRVELCAHPLAGKRLL